jgi:hypothetical protein
MAEATQLAELAQLAQEVIATLENEILSCREQMQVLMETNAGKLRLLEAWKVILQSRESDFKQLGENLQELSLAQANELPQLPTALGDEAYGSKMALVRQLLNVAASKGVTPKELGSLLENTGTKVSTSFAGNALHKMKGRGEVVFHRGRYYIPLFAPATQPGFVSYADQSLGANLQALMAYVNQEKANHASLSKEKQDSEKPLLNDLIASLNDATAVYRAFHAGTETLEAAQTALASLRRVQVLYMLKGAPEETP